MLHQNMFGWIRGVFSGILEYLIPFLYKKNGSLLLLGLDHAGKSCLLHRLKYDKMAQPNPTGLPHSETMSLGKTTFTTYDLGGHKQVRRVWKDYFPAADGILYIVDGANRERFEESRLELERMLADEDMLEIPIAVLVNKIDLSGAANEHEVKNWFRLNGSTTGKGQVLWDQLQGQRPLEVFPCSVLAKQGYGEALMWIAQYMK